MVWIWWIIRPLLQLFWYFIRKYIWQIIFSLVLYFVSQAVYYFFDKEIKQFVEFMNKKTGEAIDEMENAVWVILSKYYDTLQSMWDWFSGKFEWFIDATRIAAIVDTILDYEAIVRNFLYSFQYFLMGILTSFYENFLNPLRDGIREAQNKIWVLEVQIMQAVDMFNEQLAFEIGEFNSNIKSTTEAFNYQIRSIIQYIVEEYNSKIANIYEEVNSRIGIFNQTVGDFAASSADCVFDFVPTGRPLTSADLVDIRNRFYDEMVSGYPQIEPLQPDGYIDFESIDIPQMEIYQMHTPQMNLDLTAITEIVQLLGQKAEAVEALKTVLETVLVLQVVSYLRAEITALIRESSILAATRAVNDTILEIRSTFEGKINDLKTIEAQEKEKLRAKTEEVKQNIFQYQKQFVDSLPSMLRPIWIKAIQKGLEKAYEKSSQEMQVVIDKIATKPEEIERILWRFPNLKHGEKPALKFPQEWHIRDLYRISVNYHTRAERLALATIIITKDLNLKLDEILAELWEKLPNETEIPPGELPENSNP